MFGLSGFCLVLALLGTSPSLCLVPFTALPAWFPLSLLACLQGFSLVSCWVSTLDFGCFVLRHPLCLALLLLSFLVLLLLVGVSTVICMSEPTIEIPVSEYQALLEAASQLASAVRRIQQTVAVPVNHPLLEVVEHPVIPCGLSNLSEVYQVTAFSGVETGPPELPRACLDFCVPQLSPLFTPRPEVRTLRAFRLGFWDKISVDCHINQLRASSGEVAVDLPVCHWIVLRTLDFSFPVRFVTLSDLNRALGPEAHSSIWQGFASFEELQAYCVGASVRVPSLLRWRGTN